MNDFYPQLIQQVWHFLNSCLIYLCFVCIKSALGYFLWSVGVIILKPPAVTLHHTLILGCNARTLSSWVNFGGECWESSDPDSVPRSYISRQIKPGLPRGQQDEDSTYTTSHCSPNRTVMATPPLGQVLFNHHLNVPTCTFQSGTTLCCLEVPVTRQHPPKKVQLGGISNASCD